jgi:hypothetical protein
MGCSTQMKPRLGKMRHQYQQLNAARRKLEHTFALQSGEVAAGELGREAKRVRWMTTRGRKR